MGFSGIVEVVLVYGLTFDMLEIGKCKFTDI
jgi:hypothetical protein